MEKKGNCEIEVEAPKIILGHVKQEDREVHIAGSIFDNSTAILSVAVFSAVRRGDVLAFHRR
jgi:hypothetical protein